MPRDPPVTSATLPASPRSMGGAPSVRTPSPQAPALFYPRPIERVGVLGAGVMGTGIACHLARAGAQVLLLDLPSQPPRGRSALSASALSRAQEASPMALLDPSSAAR